MNILYAGGYKQRFTCVTDQMKGLPLGSQVLELCFGDTYIAEYCKNKGYEWTGIDLNPEFVKHAKELGYNARCEDLTSIELLPRADVCIIMGSLYHFHPNTFLLLKKMSEAAELLIVSEPVSNLSALKGIVGYFARRSANAGKGAEHFRYGQDTLIALLQNTCKSLNRKIAFHQNYKKDLIIKLIKDETN